MEPGPPGENRNLPSGRGDVPPDSEALARLGEALYADAEARQREIEVEKLRAETERYDAEKGWEYANAALDANKSFLHGAQTRWLIGLGLVLVAVCGVTITAMVTGHTDVAIRLLEIVGAALAGYIAGRGSEKRKGSPKE